MAVSAAVIRPIRTKRRAGSSLPRVDPDEAGDHQDDSNEKERLDPDRQPDHALRPARPRAALLAVSRLGNQLRPAPLARHLSRLNHVLKNTAPSANPTGSRRALLTQID